MQEDGKRNRFQIYQNTLNMTYPQEKLVNQSLTTLGKISI